MNIQDYYCVVTQDQADEAKELLIKAGEKVWEDDAFKVINQHSVLKCIEEYWYVAFFISGIETTYPKFRQMLLDKIESDGQN